MNVQVFHGENSRDCVLQKRSRGDRITRGAEGATLPILSPTAAEVISREEESRHENSLS